MNAERSWLTGDAGSERITKLRGALRAVDGAAANGTGVQAVDTALEPDRELNPLERSSRVSTPGRASRSRRRRTIRGSIRSAKALHSSASSIGRVRRHG
jgi:hypothetical protein